MKYLSILSLLSITVLFASFVHGLNLAQKTPTNEIKTIISEKLSKFNTLALAHCVPGQEGGVCDSGVCNSAGTGCNCAKWHITFPEDSPVQCNYYMNHGDTVAAFCLELFLGIISGAGYWYLGKTALAIGQIALFLGGLLIWAVLRALCGKEDAVTVKFRQAWNLGKLGWMIYAVVMIGMGNYTDKNGAPMRGL